MNRRGFLYTAGGALGSLLANRAFAAPNAPIRLINDAPANGFDFVLRNGARGRKYQVETMPGGLGVIDFDSDGWPDLFCVNGADLPSLAKSGPEYWNRLYRNNRDGTFSDVTARSGLQGTGYGIGVAVGDYNNDGLEDLLVVGVHGNTLYRNNGDGTFTDVTREAGLANDPYWSVAAAWIDYDKDGHLDLFVSNYCDWTPGTDPVCAGLGPGGRTYCNPDLYRAEPMQLYHNNGNGTFTQVRAKDVFSTLAGKGMGVAAADVLGSGRLDLFVANDNAPNLLLINNGRGFTEKGVDAGVAYNSDGRNISGMGADFADIDGNGLPDVIVTGLVNEGWEVFLNQGKGGFVDGSAQTGILPLSRAKSGWGCGFADLDNDGWPDLFVAGGGLDRGEAQPNWVFRNVGGRFVDAGDAFGPVPAPARLHRGVVFADFDRDGRIDVAVTSLDAPAELWWNRTPAQHWLQLKLEGRISNRSAIGTRVVCSTANRTQTQWVRSCVGYASSSDLALHFGIGEAQTASLEIHWPSGIAQKLSEVKADRRIVLIEPAQKSRA